MLQGVTEGSLNGGHLTEPLGTMCRPVVVPPLSQEPLVVLAGASPVVLELLREKSISIHVLAR
jgi:hypothetical protein